MIATKLVQRGKVLTARPVKKRVDFQTELLAAARTRGVSPLRIAAEIMRRRLGPQKLSSEDYFLLGLHRPGLSEAERDAFINENELTRLNQALRAPDTSSLSGVLHSKLLTEFLLRGAGFPCANSVAVARATSMQLRIPTLVGADAIEVFLRDEARYPIFGKPDQSSFGVGAASLMAVEGDQILFGDGSSTGLRGLANEIARDYPDGYLFQKLLRPHPDLAALIGPVVATLRVHSLRLAGGPEPLFLMLKLPGPGAMVDGALAGGSAAADVNPLTGQISRAQLLSDPVGKDMVKSHVTGAVLPGATLPDVFEAISLALDTHRLFQQQGVLGCDVILTPDGPVMNEINLNPLGTMAQKGMARGLLSDDFKVKFREALQVHGVTRPVRGVRL